MPGSIRRDSYHRLLAGVLVSLLTERGVHAETIDLADHPMPFYDGDLESEQGQPSEAIDLHDRLARLDGLIFATPEYNGGPSALLKNTIDWITRVDRNAFRPLLIGLVAASPGSRGGATGLASVRAICEHMRLDLVAGDVSIPHAGDAFEIDGADVRLVRDDDLARTIDYVDGLVELLADRRPRSLAS